MGMDIYSSSGVVIQVDEAVPAILRKVKKAQIPAVVEAIGSKWKFDDKSGLDEVKNLESLVAWIVAAAEKMVDKEGGYLDSIALTDLFEVVCGAVGIELPSFSFDYWTHSRISGWEVPTNTPCMVFSDDGLFETKMSKEGKRLAGILGRSEVESTTWTVMSV